MPKDGGYTCEAVKPQRPCSGKSSIPAIECCNDFRRKTTRLAGEGPDRAAGVPLKSLVSLWRSRKADLSGGSPGAGSVETKAVTLSEGTETWVGVAVG